MMIFVGAFFMVFMAEMGDKSQFLSLTLATCYSKKKVFLAILIATLINNGGAVLLGSYLGASLDLDIISWLASGTFILFGLWTLFVNGKTKGKEQQEEQEIDCEPDKKAKLAVFVSMVVTMILAEMGDKTQLATIAYAANYNAPILTLLGVVGGMLAADGIGIYLGAELKHRVPGHVLTWMSASVFIAIGLISILLTALHT